VNNQLPIVPPTATYSSLMVAPCPWDKTKLILYPTIGGQCLEPVEVSSTFDLSAYAQQFQYRHMPVGMAV